MFKTHENVPMRVTTWLACVLLATLSLSIPVHVAWAEEDGGDVASPTLMEEVNLVEPQSAPQESLDDASGKAVVSGDVPEETQVVKTDSSISEASAEEKQTNQELNEQEPIAQDPSSNADAPSTSVVSDDNDESSLIAMNDGGSADEGEDDPSLYDPSTLLDDGSVYSICAGDGSGRYLSGSSGASMVSNTGKLDSYWLVSNLGEGRYSFTNVSTEKKLSSDGSSRVGADKSIFKWIVIRCTDGMLSLAPEGYEDMRLDVATSPALSSDSGSLAQRFAFSVMTALTDAVRDAYALDDGDGLYKIGLGVGGNTVVDVSGGSSANGANVQVYRSNDSAAQRVSIRHAGSGLYTLEVLRSGKCLDAKGGGMSPGTNVQQYEANGTLAQLWYFVIDGNGYVLRNAKSGLALDVCSASTANGTNIQLYTPNGTNAQRVLLIRDLPLERAIACGSPISSGIYTFASALNKNLVLDIANGSITDSGNVQIYTSNGGMAQKFEVTPIGYGLYTIQAGNSGKYLDAYGGGTTNGTNVQQYSYNGTRAQLWYFVKSGSGFVVCNAKSSLVLDVTSAKAANNTNIQLYTANGTPAQTFSLNSVGLLANGTYMLTSTLSASQVVTVSGRSSNNGANVQISRMSRSSADLWVFTYLGNSAYRITNKNSGKALDVVGGSLANGGNIQQYTPNGTDAQKWVLGISNTGALTIRNVRSGKYVDLNGGKSSSGTNVQQYTGNETSAQSFVAYAASSDFASKGKSGYQNPSQYYQISAFNCVLPSYAKGYHTYVTSSRISPLATRSQCVEAFIARAYDYLHTGYVWDYSTAPGGGVDCSGLVMQCLYAVGMQTPYNPYDHMYDPWQDHNAENMHADSKFKKISFSSRKRGDLIFYAGHVAIYLGNNKIIHAWNPTVDVVISNVYAPGAVTGCSRVFV